MWFYSGQIRTLVGITTYSSNRFIMGKVEINILSISMEIFEKNFRNAH